MIGIGDVLMTTPALALLKKNKPESKVTYCTMNKGTYEVLKGNPDIDNLIYYPFVSNNNFFALINFIKEQSFRYSTSITFYPSNRMHYNIVSLLTFAPQRVGHTYLHMNFSQLNWLKNKTIIENDSLHCVEENVKLLELCNINTSNIDIPPMRIYLTEQEIESGIAYRKSISPSTCCIGVHAGTSILKGHMARRWPKEYFLELINRTNDAHFVLFGTNEEREANEFILKNADPGKVTLVKNKSIRDVAAIIRACDFFLSNDSGLMHLAAAVGKPVIALIGPTNPIYIKPWGVYHKVISAPVKCCHCFIYSPKPLTCTNKNNFQCLTEISVDMVERELKEFIQLNRSRSLF